MADMPSTYTNDQEEGQQPSPLMIHADALPCLKRQQLENLCNRLGLKSTGKKEELIARLQGFAMGQSASVISNLHSSSNEEEVQSQQEEETKHDNVQELEEEGQDNFGDLTMLPNSASIRVISKPRESHFTTSAAPDPFQMEIGVVLPRSGSSNGSLSSLTNVEKKFANLPTNNSSNIFLDKKPVVQQQKQRIGSGSSSMYPWKKLLNNNSKKSSIDSLAKIANGEQSSAPTPAMAEMGLGLHASDSQASISSTVKKWLKGEGSSTITPSFPSNRRITRSISAASSVISVALNGGKEEKKKEEEVEVEQASTMVSKRKRSSDEGCVDDLSSVPTSPEVPQRRIKPRPSRAKKSINPTSNMTAQEKVWAEMNARLAQQKAANGEMNAERKVSQSSTTSTNNSTPLLPPSPLKSVNSRTKGRFSSQHDKEFHRMDSIASHYAARRGDTVRKASNESDQGQNVPSSKRAKVSVSQDKVDDVKTVTYAPVHDTALPQRSQEERAAIKRKLELARHRRRSSTAAARASASSVTARRAAAATASSNSSSGPSSKLASSIKTFGFAVRGLMGAATRGLSSNNSATPVTGTVGKGKIENTNSIMKPPQVPIVQKQVDKKPSIQTFNHSSPIKTNVPTVVNKKRSTFDLQASLARKPTGYTPYSARETVEMLSTSNSPLKPSTMNLDPSTISRSSSITFPSSSPAKKVIEKMQETEVVEEMENVENLTENQTLSISSPRTTTIKKTRSSASHAARSSIRAGRKSNTPSTGMNKRRTTPSLQSVNQTMAKEMLSARRSRTNAMMLETNSSSSRNRRSSAAIQATAKSSRNSAPKPLPPLPSPVQGQGHGSPKKSLNNFTQFVEGKGRGKSNFVQSVNQEDVLQQTQRRISSRAIRS